MPALDQLQLKRHKDIMQTTFQNVYDISVTLGSESIDYPGDTAYKREQLCSIASGDGYNLSSLHMSCHAGTHLDAPSHFIKGGKNIDEFPASTFIFPSHVVEISSPEAISVSEIESLRPEPGTALLFKTRNSLSGMCKNSIFSERFVYLTPEAARLCAEWKLGLVGVDYITAEKYGAPEFINHHLLLEKEILILEGLNLEAIRPGRYTLICLPLNLQGAEGSPTRAILAR